MFSFYPVAVSIALVAAFVLGNFVRGGNFKDPSQTDEGTGTHRLVGYGIMAIATAIASLDPIVAAIVFAGVLIGYAPPLQPMHDAGLLPYENRGDPLMNGLYAVMPMRSEFVRDAIALVFRGWYFAPLYAGLAWYLGEPSIYWLALAVGPVFSACYCIARPISPITAGEVLFGAALGADVALVLAWMN